MITCFTAVELNKENAERVGEFVQVLNSGTGVLPTYSMGSREKGDLSGATLTRKLEESAGFEDFKLVLLWHLAEMGFQVNVEVPLHISITNSDGMKFVFFIEGNLLKLEFEWHGELHQFLPKVCAAALGGFSVDLVVYEAKELNFGGSVGLYEMWRLVQQAHGYEATEPQYMEVLMQF